MLISNTCLECEPRPVASGRRGAATRHPWLRPALLAAVVAGFGQQAALASTTYGDLNNFDAVNDTGQDCHGFEIELDGVRSTDITYTYDWNHFGPPRITEDASDPANPKVFVRYEARKNPDGTWVDGSFTRVPTQPLTPTDGHFCTDTSNYSYGCEHFGVGFYGAPTAIKYNWLLDNGSGTLVTGPAVSVGTPSFTYVPPAAAVPAQVVAVIPAPPVPIPVARQFGDPVWVRVIKTTSHNANPVQLKDLVSADNDQDGMADWQNGEPDQVEAEWKLLQTNSAGNVAKAEEPGQPDEAGDGSEVVTRRYEFYRYAADDSTLNDVTDGSSLDGETGEAMCDEVMSATDLHGLRSSVTVTGPDGNPYTIDCSARIVVGDYLGAQMAGFDAAAPLGLIDHLQDGEKDVLYTPRVVVVGGNSPYVVNILDGSLPPGLSMGADGVLSGTPTSGGQFVFTVTATDADGVAVTAPYTLEVVSAAAVQHQLTVQKTGSGSGTVAGTSGIDCGTACAVLLDEGSTVTLTATPDAGSVFSGWSGACAGTADCVVTLTADTVATANFTRRYDLTVSKAGTGTGTVSGNGIDCGTTCALAFDAGTAISLTATPTAGSVFSGWSGDCAGTGACVLAMDANHAVTATFAVQASSYTLAVTRTGAGTVTSSPKGINCGSTCSKTFNTGTSVTLTAKPAKKHVFLGWSGACSGTALTCTVQMQGNRSVGATFN